jgi:aspartate 4-decarboxylase
VLLPGGGFYAPPLSVRVSLSNLPDETYEHIGDNLEAVMQGYFEEWQRARHT